MKGRPYAFETGGRDDTVIWNFTHLRLSSGARGKVCRTDGHRQRPDVTVHHSLQYLDALYGHCCFFALEWSLNRKQYFNVVGFRTHTDGSGSPVAHTVPARTPDLVDTLRAKQQELVLPP